MNIKNENLEKNREDLLACNLCGFKFCMYFCPIFDLTKSESSFSTGLNHYALGILDGLAEYTDSAVSQIYKCTLCGACRDARCVASGMGDPVDTPKIVESMRADIVGQGKAPGRIRRWGNNLKISKNIYNYSSQERYAWAPKDLLSKEKAEIIYFAGCVSSYSHTEIPKAVIKILSKVDADFTIMKEEACCGLPMLQTGQLDIAEEFLRYNIEHIKKIKAKKVLFSCPGCYMVFKEAIKDFNIRLGFKPLFILDYIEEQLNNGKLKIKGKINKKVTYHDPCHLGRFLKVYDAPRRLIEKIPGLELIEMERNREFSRCCGAGGGVKVLFPELASSLGGKRLQDALETGADNLITSCPSCKDLLKDVSRESGSGIDIYDIVELIAEKI